MYSEVGLIKRLKDHKAKALRLSRLRVLDHIHSLYPSTIGEQREQVGLGGVRPDPIHIYGAGAQLAVHVHTVQKTGSAAVHKVGAMLLLLHRRVHVHVGMREARSVDHVGAVAATAAAAASYQALKLRHQAVLAGKVGVALLLHGVHGHVPGIEAAGAAAIAAAHQRVDRAVGAADRVVPVLVSAAPVCLHFA